MATVRVAAAQLAVGTDLDDNLRTCVAAIDEAAHARAALVVLPEFCNHLSWYEDRAHAARVAVTLDGPFLGAVSARAAAHKLYVVINVTLRRAPAGVTATSLCYAPDGALVGAADKQVLIGHENDFFERAQRSSRVIETAIGRLGLYACMDGVICETPRALALRGAQILCNSLNSFALDEASLHVPVRAAENKVFVVAANKVGPLLPAPLLEPVGAAIGIPPRFLHGAGESQIVAPDGSVLARAAREGEALVVADIEVARADDKRRPDGTDLFRVRRPSLYRAIGEPPERVTPPPGSDRLEAAVWQPLDTLAGEPAIAAAAEAVRAAEAALVVLPELFCFAGGVVDDLDEAWRRSELAQAALVTACRGEQRVVTTLVHKVAGGYRHDAVLLGERGVLHRQPSLHRSARHPWARLGDRLELTTLRWGRLALLVGDDALQPESFRLAAIAGAEVVALPFHAQEPWELALGLVERAAENRVCVAAASRGGALLATLEEDVTLMTPWKHRRFDGLLSHPIVKRSDGPGLLRATLHPHRAANKVISHRTHLVDGRPWHLVDAITQE